MAVPQPPRQRRSSATPAHRRCRDCSQRCRQNRFELRYFREADTLDACSDPLLPTGSANDETWGLFLGRTIRTGKDGDCENSLGFLPGDGGVHRDPRTRRHRPTRGRRWICRPTFGSAARRLHDSTRIRSGQLRKRRAVGSPRSGTSGTWHRVSSSGRAQFRWEIPRAEPRSVRARRHRSPCPRRPIRASCDLLVEWALVVAACVYA
jgi:hypothetical protein